MKLGYLLLLFLVIFVAAIEARPADIEVFDIEPEGTDYEEVHLLTGEESTTVDTAFSTFMMEHLQWVRAITMMICLLVLFWAIH